MEKSQVKYHLGSGTKLRVPHGSFRRVDRGRLYGLLRKKVKVLGESGKKSPFLEDAMYFLIFSQAIYGVDDAVYSCTSWGKVSCFGPKDRLSRTNENGFRHGISCFLGYRDETSSKCASTNIRAAESLKEISNQGKAKVGHGVPELASFMVLSAEQKEQDVDGCGLGQDLFLVGVILSPICDRTKGVTAFMCRHIIALVDVGFA